MRGPSGNACARTIGITRVAVPQSKCAQHAHLEWTRDESDGAGVNLGDRVYCFCKSMRSGGYEKVPER